MWSEGKDIYKWLSFDCNLKVPKRGKLVEFL